jgi:heat shock protein HslJ
MVENLAVGGELVPPLEGGRPLTLKIEKGRVSGCAGINRFMGTIGDDNPFPMLVTTTMAGPDELMAQERIILAHFESVDSFEPSDSEMLLLSQEQVVLTLKPVGTGDTSATS